MSGFLTRLPCSRAEADAASLSDDPFDGQDPQPTLVATEVDDGWELHLYTEQRPDAVLLAQFAALAPSAGVAPAAEALPDADWLTLSQAGLEPVDAGRFHIHTADHQGRHRPGQWPLRINAGLAFGTGQHDTTRGCLLALQRLARRARPAAVLDVGTGTGILAFAAARLFPRARLLATDIDARAVAVARANGRANGVPPGRIGWETAFGVAHARIARQGPWPLVCANILAKPLAAMAPALAPMVASGGHLIMAGLLAGQRQRMIAIYRAHGFRVVDRGAGQQWPVLVLEKRTAAAPKAGLRRARKGTLAEARRADSI